jgi:hypothetical protein
MKTKVLVLSFVFCLTFLIVIGSCAATTGPNKMVYDRLYGTWVNSAYEGKGSPRLYNVLSVLTGELLPPADIPKGIT